MWDEPAALDPVDGRALSRLLSRTLGQGFRLVICEVASPRRQHHVTDWLAPEVAALDGRLRTLDVTAIPRENLWQSLREALADEPAEDLPRLVLALHGFQQTGDPDRDNEEGLYRQLNVQRDLFVRDLPCFWVVFVHPYGSRRMQGIAPDFCDFASLWLKARADDI
ncbi:MAG: hypothetical protein H6703_07505, partial [Myxococcales bacterium]|nr:hypothetical protein [Myxococcales bacterium]